MLILACIGYLLLNAANSVGTPATALSATTSREPEKSLVIVQVDKFDFQPDETVSVSNKPDDFFLGGVYRASAKTLKVLSGPPIGERVEISLAGLHIDRWRKVKLLMVVRKETGDRLWAGQQWQRITNEICLADDEIKDWQIGSLFASAKRRNDGLQCIGV